MATAEKPQIGGVTREGFRNRKVKEVWEKVTVAAGGSAATLSTPIPAYSRVLWSDIYNEDTLALSTAVRVGLGTTADPDLYGLSGLTLTAGTHNAPYFGWGNTMLYSNQAASTALTNSVTATTFDTKYSMPANSLKPGDVIRVKYQGIATATNSTDTLAIDVVFGGTTIAATAATDAADNDIFVGEFDIIVRSVGATGTFVARGFGGALGASGTATGRARFKASTSFDTTAAFDVGVQGTWSVASASNSCRLDVITIELCRPGNAITQAQTDLKLTPVSAAGAAAGTFNSATDFFVNIVYEEFPRFLTA